MGAALSSHGLSDPAHFQLLSEYIDHSRKTADECAQIFRGALGAYDDDEPDGASPPRMSARKPAYPRHLQSAQFEEVFGMLVSDPEPHFLFFQEKSSSTTAKAGATTTACAHRVFCAVALLMRADLHAKIDFVLRLYADVTGSLTTEAKSSLLNDFVKAVDCVLQFSDPIPSDVLAAIEKSFWSDDPEQLLTVWELYSVCLTNPRISGLLHDIHALIENFSFSYRRERLRQRESHAQLHQLSALSNDGSNSPRRMSLARSMSSITLPRDSLLWEMKAADYGRFWHQTEPLEILSDVTCSHALEKMARAEATSALVVKCARTAHTETRQYIGLVTTDKLLSYFLDFLDPDLDTTASKPYEHSRAHAEDAIRQFGSTPLCDVMRFFVTDRAPLLCSVRDDEAFFSVLVRFACGESALAVVQDYRSAPEAVLGQLTVFDILGWLEEDLTLLRGKERSSVAAFPEFFYAPAAIDAAAASASVCEAFIEMKTRGLSGILVAAGDGKDGEEKTLSADAFRDLFSPTFASLRANNNNPGPLLCALSASANALPSACVVSPNTSIARVIREMADRRTRRVIIRRDDGVSVGAVRATDVLLLLLRAQHTSYRPRGPRASS